MKFSYHVFLVYTIQGCDDSVLLDSTPGNPAERYNPANNPSLRGFHVIHAAKVKIEAQCPQTVSCADILAFAARDSAHNLGGIRYVVPAGRRDGRVSSRDEAGQNLPSPSLDAQQLKNRFEAKGLSLDEMVTLSGAHSIGVSHCSSFTTRLYNSSQPSPSIDVKFFARLKSKCPATAGVGDNEDPTVPLDKHSPNRLDNHYYVNLKQKKGVLASDQSLFDSALTSGMVRRNAKNHREWAAKFATAMVRMGSINVMTGNQGEIRKNCGVVN
ncbi:hypothetical protein ACLOJK_021975 [Asimina triloba]